MRIDTRGLSFDVRISGPEDGRPVVLLHGFPQHSGEWRKVEPLLHAAGLRTIAPDQRGYSPGARPADPDAYHVDECAEDVVGLVDALGLDTVDVVGHDWGAAVAWHVAGRHPERVRTLTAVSVPHPVAFTTAIRSDADQKAKSAYMLFFRQEGVAEKTLLAADAKALRMVFRGSDLSDAEVDEYVRPLRAEGALTAALNWYRAPSGAAMEKLDPVTVPTTYVWSDEDLALGRTGAELCGRYVTGDYRFVELPGISHWVADQAPEPLADAIIARITG